MANVITLNHRQLLSTQECQEILNHVTMTYNIGVVLSLALTVYVGYFRGFCLRRRLEDARFRRTFYGVTGIIKIVMAGLLGLVFLPTCPSGCICNGDMSYYMIYPMIAFLIGVQWIAAAASAHADINNTPAVLTVVAVPIGEEEDRQEMVTTKTKGDFKSIPTIDSELNPV